MNIREMESKKIVYREPMFSVKDGLKKNLQIHKDITILWIDIVNYLG